MLRMIWTKIRWRLRHLGSDDKAGIYLTVIAHLAVIIVLLAVQINTELRRSDTFLLDFSGQEAEDARIREDEFRESISRRLDEMLGDIPVTHPERNPDGNTVRNIAVDASGHLKDDRNTDAARLYADAEKLADELRSGQGHAIEEDARDEAVEIGQEQDGQGEDREKEYSGPSVLSYSLDGRKASHLRIPAYKCYGGGEVTVIIVVDPSGRVLNAKVMDEISSTDQCLRDFAIRAARLSRFSVSRTAPPRQTGEIVYRFIAQ